MRLTQQTRFQSELLTIRHAVASPTASPCSELLYGLADLLILPVAGVFAKHDAPKQHFIANANHGLFFVRDQAYRISFPGRIGDEAMVLGFSQAALNKLLQETVGAEQLHAVHLHKHCLLAPASMLMRNLLWHKLQQADVSTLEIEETAIAIFSSALHAACKDKRHMDYGTPALTQLRRNRQVETVKEIISLDPAKDWALSSLANAANSSAYHLARVFREEVGIAIHQYLIRTRINKGLIALRMGNQNLSQLALDAGFSNHSHFTSSFKALLGITPGQLQRHLSK